MFIADEMMRIFQGHEGAHGEYRIESQKGAKAVGKARTVQQPVTLPLWEAHLLGKMGLGVVPINKKSRCVWGAVDVDVYDGLDLEDLSLKLPEPLVLCRSKSGGAHIYLFTNQPVTAHLMRKKLGLVARAIGHPTAEIFPKQDEIKDGDTGNWINMPYFNFESTTRYAIKGGVALSCEEFISLVSEMAVSNEQLVQFEMESIHDAHHEDPEFSDAPPCLQALVKQGFPPGSRNSGLFCMGVFARKKFPNGWEDKVFEYNQRFMGPGSYTEVAGIIRSLNKRSYIYKCKDQPCVSYCERERCGTMPYGVPMSDPEERSKRKNILEDVERPVVCYAPHKDSTDEPYWIFTISGQKLNVTLEMVTSQNFFSKEYLRQFHRVLLPIKDAKWADAMNEILAEAEIRELAPDAGPEGQFWAHVEEFCSSSARAKTKDELLIGKPWEDDGRIYFRSMDLLKYLDQQRFRALKEKDIVRIIKRRDGKHHSFVLKEKRVSCWSIFTFTVQKEGFDPVEVPNNVEY